MKTIYESMGGIYEKQGDYLVPALMLADEKEYEIGAWGQRYRRYLKEHHRILYYNYLTSGTLDKHLAEVDERARVMYETMVKSLAEKENITENMKKQNAMLWIAKMNSVRNRVMEIVNQEVIYV